MFQGFLYLQTTYTSAHVESNLETTKSAASKLHLGEKQSNGQEASRPQRRNNALKKEMKRVQSALCSACVSENCTESKNKISAKLGKR